MEVIATREGFRTATFDARSKGAQLGLVATMGSLHEGHLSLLKAASSDCDVVAMTIFVNPIQFSSPEDLVRYPSNLEQDVELARDAGVAIVFAPTADEMYPGGAPETRVDPGPLGCRLEGASRPGHFAGVATVVTKLVSICGQCRAYFGEKDFQQLSVVRKVVGDLDLDADIVGCPTIRESDGLACSSRNRRLHPADRAAARVLFQALETGRAQLEAGEADLADVQTAMRAVVGTEPRAKLDYAVVVDPITFELPIAPAAELRLLIAADFAGVRLIDNVAARR